MIGACVLKKCSILFIWKMIGLEPETTWSLRRPRGWKVGNGAKASLRNWSLRWKMATASRFRSELSNFDGAGERLGGINCTNWIYDMRYDSKQEKWAKEFALRARERRDRDTHKNMGEATYFQCKKIKNTQRAVHAEEKHQQAHLCPLRKGNYNTEA